MKRKFQNLTSATVLMAAVLTGCFLSPPPPRSAYRPIHRDVEAGNIAAVAADLATNSSDLNLPDDVGLTPLHLAAIHCRTNIIVLLLGKGAKINCTAKDGATPLHLAAQEGCVGGVELLLAKGAKVNARDKQGRTPLGRAEQWHQDSIVQLLRRDGGTE